MSDASNTVRPEAVRHDDPDGVTDAGTDSRVYHESTVANLGSVHDERTRQILVNEQLTSTESLLVDTVTYEPGVSCPMHYHHGTEHFFYVIEGEGIIEIEGDELEISEGSVVWVGDGDEHRLYAREDQDGMRLLEFFSEADHETVYTSGKACTWTPESV